MRRSIPSRNFFPKQRFQTPYSDTSDEQRISLWMAKSFEDRYPSIVAWINEPERQIEIGSERPNEEQSDEWLDRLRRTSFLEHG